MAKPFHRLIYSSRIELPFDEKARAAEIDSILAASRRNNFREDITGALLVNRVCFIQILEGPTTAVRSSFDRIGRDQRHSQLMVLESRAVDERGFAGFPMAFVDAAGPAEGGVDLLSLAFNELGVFAAIRRQVLDVGRLVA